MQFAKIVPASLLDFFSFMRLFWNQIFICLSVSLNVRAKSIRLALFRYWLALNDSSRCMSCSLEYAVRCRFCFSRLRTPPTAVWTSAAFCCCMCCSWCCTWCTWCCCWFGWCAWCTNVEVEFLISVVTRNKIQN